MINVDHYLPIFPRFYAKILSGEKKHEIRKGVGFLAGQVIQFQETHNEDCDALSGRSAFYRITHVDEINISTVYRFAVMSIERFGS